MQSLYLSDLKESATRAAHRAAQEHQSCFKQTEVIQYQESLRSLNLEDPDFTNPLLPGPRHSRDLRKWTTRQRAVTVAIVISLLTLVAVIAMRLQQVSADSSGRKNSQSPALEQASLLNLLTGKNSRAAESRPSMDSAGGSGRSSADRPKSMTERAARFLNDANSIAASSLPGKSASVETAETFADRISSTWKSDVTELENPGDPQRREETLRYLKDVDQALETADQGQDRIRIRQVRSEVLSQMTRLLISEGNFPAAIDTLTKAAALLPDSPGHQKLAGNLAEAMVAGLESGDGRITMDIVVPWIDQSARFGVPLDLRSALHRRVREAKLLAIRKLQNEGTERSQLPAVEAMKAMKKENPQNSDIMAAEANLTRALLNDAEKALEIGDLKSASLNLKAAVSLRNSHGDEHAAADRMARKVEDAFSKALNEKQFAAVAALYEMLSLLVPDRLFAADDALRRLSMKELSVLPEWLRDLILKRTNSIKMKFSLVPNGSFLMGAARLPRRRDLPDYPDSPQHQVTISKSCYLGQFEVTLAQYQHIMGDSADSPVRLPAPDENSAGDTESLPCDGLTWFQATKFCERLTAVESERESGRRYRLPREAEWEFACRADSTTDYADNNSADSITAIAWYANNSGRLKIDDRLSLQNDYQRLLNLIVRTQPRLHPTGLKSPNSWSFHDLHGNAAEWVQDWFAEYTGQESVDPAGPESGTEKVLRGGSFRDDSTNVSASRRFAAPPDRPLAGFRVVLEYFPVPVSTAPGQ
jgi:formylglycine-generating enzyme required for sulfatase activity